MDAAELTTFVEELRKELICSICSETFTDPIKLPCLHSYCSKCFYGQSEGSRDGEFTCPTCGTRMELSKGHSSLYLNSLLNLLHAMSSEPSQREECLSCERTSEMVAFCPHCDGTICSRCFDAHTTLKQLREKHHATMLDEFKQENVEDFIKNQMLCKEKYHEKSKLVYYCKEETCKRCICQECCTLSHKDHTKVLIAEEVEHAKQVIQDCSTQINQVNGKLNEKLILSVLNLSEIEIEIETAKKSIKWQRKIIVKNVNYQANLMIKGLDKTLREQRKKYQNEQKNIETGMENNTEIQEYNQVVLSNNRMLQILENHDGIKLRGQAAGDFLKSLKPCKRLSVRYERNRENEGSLENIGRIVETLANPDTRHWISRFISVLGFLICSFFVLLYLLMKKICRVCLNWKVELLKVVLFFVAVIFAFFIGVKKNHV